jgi:hypothetical protein
MNIINEYDIENYKKKLNKKIFNYQKKIINYESKFNFIKVDYDELKKFYKKINNYKFICILLYNNPDFYIDIKYLQIDNYRELNEIVYLEIFWLNQHYEFIEEIRSIENDIKQLFQDAYKYGLITNIQYKLVKKIMMQILKIFELDKSLEKLYGEKLNSEHYISKKEIEFYFDILEIILLKIYSSNNSSNKIYNLCKNEKYTNLINKIKINLIKKNNFSI